MIIMTKIKYIPKIKYKMIRKVKYNIIRFDAINSVNQIWCYIDIIIHHPKFGVVFNAYIGEEFCFTYTKFDVKYGFDA